MGKNKKKIGFMKDELGGKIMKEFIKLKPKRYAYLMDDGNVDKEAKETKRCVIKRLIMYDNYRESLKEKKENIKKATKI